MPPKSKDSKQPVTLFNPRTTPVVYSATGHTIGAAEHREVGTLDEVGQRAVDEGVLVVQGGQREEEKTDTGESGADGRG